MQTRSGSSSQIYTSVVHAKFAGSTTRFARLLDNRPHLPTGRLGAPSGNGWRTTKLPSPDHIPMAIDATCRVPRCVRPKPLLLWRCWGIEACRCDEPFFHRPRTLNNRVNMVSVTAVCAHMFPVAFIPSLRIKRPCFSIASSLRSHLSVERMLRHEILGGSQRRPSSGRPNRANLWNIAAKKEKKKKVLTVKDPHAKPNQQPNRTCDYNMSSPKCKQTRHVSTRTTHNKFPTIKFTGSTSVSLARTTKFQVLCYPKGA